MSGYFAKLKFFLLLQNYIYMSIEIVVIFTL